MRVIAGTARRLQLITPEGKNTRPTTDKVKETLFNILAPELPGCQFLDLFAGSGGIAIEALSRGAAGAALVERNRDALQCIRKNLEHTHFADKATVLGTDVFQAIRRLDQRGQAYQFIFLDPPYHQGLEFRVLEALASTSLILTDTLIIAETAADEELDALAQLPYDILRIKRYKNNQHIFLRGH